MNRKTEVKKASSPTNPKKKVALGMSGGVDSSLCAHLLQEQGYEVVGVYLECWRAPGCRSEEDRKDALKVALSLDLPFKVLDFKQAYRDKVVENFFVDYEAGKTPNPDVACNKEIKFGLFYDWAMENGFDYVATGHYAKSENGILKIPKDEHKDQTYFLYQISKDQLEHVLFPLEDIPKSEVRTEAQKRKIHVSDKKDSVGICFIGDINVHQFLKDRLGENPGEVINTKGEVIGKHTGLWFYTIGQRHGFTIDKKTVLKLDDGTTITRQNIPPFYVIQKLADENQLVVGFGAETYRSEFEAEEMHWISGVEPARENLEENLLVRIRHTGQLISCVLKNIDGAWQVKLNEPARGVAEGQAAVFYSLKKNQEKICLGGGVIG
jgi:tRNA-uridine 2-sulfurtransferase